MTEQELYRWRGESSHPDISGIAGVDGLLPFEDAKAMLDAHLYAMAERWPKSRRDIQMAKNSLLLLHASTFSAVSEFRWAHRFTIIDTEPHCVVTLSLTREARKTRNIPAQREYQPEELVQTSQTPPTPPPARRQRAGHPEKDSLREHLSWAFANGYIDSDEFERRMNLVRDAVYIDQLPEAVAELPAQPADTIEPTLPSSLQHELSVEAVGQRKAKVIIGFSVLTVIAALIFAITSATTSGAASRVAAEAGGAILLIGILFFYVASVLMNNRGNRR